MASRRLDRLDRTGSALGALLYHRHRSFGRSLDSPSLREAVPATSAEVSDLTPLVPHAVVATGPAGMAATAALRAHVGHAVDAAMWHSVRRRARGMHVPVLLTYGEREQRMVRRLVNAWSARDPLVISQAIPKAGDQANQDKTDAPTTTRSSPS